VGGSASSSGGTAAGGQGATGGGIIQLPDSGTSAGCTATAVEGQLRPVMLATLLDVSGSMGTKWVPVSTALRSFFSDPASAGISASLKFFPELDATYSGGFGTCEPNAYLMPKVPMTLLPSSVIASAVPMQLPGGAKNTPTYPALSGTIVYAQQIQAANPGALVAIVLATDGDPKGCTGNTVASVAAKAAEVAAQIPTYVIGIGNVAGLDTVAQSGGTGAAFIVDVIDPAQTQQDFVNVLNTIRGTAVPCDIDIPPPPQGQTLDPGLVNVNFTAASGAVTLLPMSADCTADSGWRYDNPQAPTRIELCPGACQTVKSGFGGRLDVEFGCATVIY
jgi:hypothetical protein